MTEALQQEIRTLRSLFQSERDPDGRVFAPLADAYLRAGRLDDALAVLTEGLAKHPEFVPGHVVAARLYREQGLTEEAGLAARRALDLDGECVSALETLVQVLEARGDEAEVTEVLDRLILLEPDYASHPLARSAVPWADEVDTPSPSASPEPQALIDVSAVDFGPLGEGGEAPEAAAGGLDYWSEPESAGGDLPLSFGGLDAPGEPADEASGGAAAPSVLDPTWGSDLGEGGSPGLEGVTILPAGDAPQDGEPEAEREEAPAWSQGASLDVEEPVFDLEGLGTGLEPAEAAASEEDRWAAEAPAEEPVPGESVLEEPVLELDALSSPPDADELALATTFSGLTLAEPPSPDVGAGAGPLADEEPEEERVVDLGSLGPDEPAADLGLPGLDEGAWADGGSGDEDALDVASLAREDEAVLDIAALRPEPAGDQGDEDALDVSALAPEEEGVLDVAALAPEEEGVLDVAALAPEDDEGVLDVTALAPEDDEGVLDVAALAPEDEGVLDVTALAPEDDEGVLDVSALAPEDDEGALDVAALAPEDEEGVLDVAALAPEDDEGVLDVATLAPEDDGDALDVGALAPDDEPGDGATDLPYLSLGEPDESDEEVLPVAALSPDPAEGSPDGPDGESLSGRGPEEIVIDMDALGRGRTEDRLDDRSFEADPEEEKEPEGPEEAPSTAASEGDEDPGEPLYTRTLAELYVKQGAVGEAIRVYRHLLERDPSDPTLLRRLRELEAGGGEEAASAPAPTPVAAERDEELESLARDLARSGDADPEVESPFAWSGEGEREEPEASEGSIGDYFDSMLAWEPRDEP